MSFDDRLGRFERAPAAAPQRAAAPGRRRAPVPALRPEGCETARRRQTSVGRGLSGGGPQHRDGCIAPYGAQMNRGFARGHQLPGSVRPRQGTGAVLRPVRILRHVKTAPAAVADAPALRALVPAARDAQGTALGL